MLRRFQPSLCNRSWLSLVELVTAEETHPDPLESTQGDGASVSMSSKFLAHPTEQLRVPRFSYHSGGLYFWASRLVARTLSRSVQSKRRRLGAVSRGFLPCGIGTEWQNRWSSSQTSLSRGSSSGGSWLELGLSYPQSSKRDNECFLSHGLGSDETLQIEGVIVT